VGVPRFEPFRALRHDPRLAPLDLVTAPPYDVLSDADVDDLSGRHRANIVHVDVPREVDGPDRYERAARVLSGWIDEAVLITDPLPSFTLYRMQFDDEAGHRRETVGVIGALEVVDEGAGGVLPHERTTPKAKTDRLDLTRATRTNLSPVWGLSLTSGLTGLLQSPGEPVGSVTVDGVTHTVERVSDPDRVDAIRTAVSANSVVIADGHHRYAIARTYRDEVRALTGRHDTDAELTMTYVGELVVEQLSVEAIHRVYRDIDDDILLGRLKAFFTAEPLDGGVDADVTAVMADRGALCFIDPDGRGTLLTPRHEKMAGIRDLDGARLEHALDGLDHEVSYQHGVALARDLVTSGAANAAVLIRPVTVAEIRRTADEGALMPPKSTFFTPKLRTGLVMRPLDLA
jgi:uncharacterized protein (DUF1015 family)